MVHPGHSPKKTRRTPLLPALVSAGCFLLICGALVVLANRPGLNPVAATPSRPAEPALAPVSPDLPAAAEVEREQGAPLEDTLVAAAPVRHETNKVVTGARQPVERVEQPSRLDVVDQQLAAGEFGPALETAAAETDALTQTEILQRIAAAQMAAGEFDAAQATMFQIPIPGERVQTAGEQASQEALAGGGTFADFQSLMDLIQTNTSGPWEDIEGVGGTMSQFETGVRVDPKGLLMRLTTTEQNGRLAALGIRAREADLNDDMARTSPLRLVSLVRLEREVARRLAEGRPVLETMAQLAGLTGVTHLIVLPEERDVIIGGPAEGWRYNEHGQPVGLESGRPTLQLDDLVVVLRTFAPHSGASDFGCSINTREDGLRRLKEYAEKSQSRGALSPSAVRPWVRQLQKQLGKQDVVVWGVPATSRVARVIVEADYRMKLIGIDKLDGGPAVPSYFDLLATNLNGAPPAMEALRWWLTMKYDAVLHSPDRTVFEIQGSSVLCQSENQMLTADGKHLPTGKSEGTNRLFAQNFTDNYAGLAARDLIFADTQNVFDLALVAALVHHERLGDRAGWTPGAFAADGAYRPAVYAAPREIDSVVNHRVYNGKDIVVQVAGGVRADLLSVVRDPEIVQEAPRLKNLAADARAPHADGRWWWDAVQ